MKFILSVAVVCLFCIKSQAKGNAFSVAKGKPVKVIQTGKQTFLVNENGVSWLQKETPGLVIKPEGGITDAFVLKDELWLATSMGVKVYNIKDFKETKHYFTGKRISAMSNDPTGKVWVATHLDGVYSQLSADSFEQKLNVVGTYALRCTADSNVWIGTNVGMYRINTNDLKITRYAEEGYSGYELPDNIVERLYDDEQSNIWVLMPDNISFKSGEHYQGEIPSYAYVGDRNNEIKTIVSLKKTSYLFVTQKGVYLLPSATLKEEHEHGTSEIFSTHQTQAFSLKGTQIGAPDNLLSEEVIFAEKAGGEIYFITAKGGWKIKEKELVKRMLKG